MQKVADIPLTLEQGFVTAPAEIEHRAVTMVIDTGAEATLVTPNAVATLPLQRDPRARTTLHGTGGSVVTQNVRLQSFGIGGMEMLDQSYAVGVLPSRTGQALHAAGLLGADWLADFDVDFDLPHGRLALYRTPGCEGDYLPWTQPRTTLRSMRYGRGLQEIDVRLDGMRLKALLDSGAARSVVAQAASVRAGTTEAALAADPAGRSKGIDGTEQATHLHRFAALDIGPEHVRDARLVVGPLQTVGGVEMLLGVDWLRAHRVWISDRAHRVSVQRADAGG